MSSEIKPAQPEGTVILRKVRLSFPDLFVAKQYQGAGPFNYRATFLVDPGSDNDKAIRDLIRKVANAKWGAKAATILPTIEGQSQKYCYVPGDTKSYDGYAGKMALSASRPQDSGHPVVRDRDMRDIAPEEGRPYGGCFVNCLVQLWAQDNSFGKGIRATIIWVQFVSDGESFGGAPQATDGGMEAVEDAAADYV